jgi:hypothetical protein
MPDPIARKRLKKKMLDRWENEGGALAADTTAAGEGSLTSEDKPKQKKPASQRDNSTVRAPASPKTPKPTRK